jgi:hypothetical protein
MVRASFGGLVGLGGLWCSGRLTGQLLILRLITRGLDLSRRGPRVLARISATACSCAVAIVKGGKSRLCAGAAAGGPKACSER